MPEATKQNKLNRILDKLRKLIAHFDNENPNEAHAAWRRATELLKSAELDWRDFLNLTSNNKESIAEVLFRLLEKEAEALIRIGRTGATYFCDPGGNAFADIMADGRRETRPLTSDEFADWLTNLFYAEKKKAPTSAAMKNAIRTLRAHARFEGERHKVHLRVAEYDGKIYLDLADSEWRAAEIDASGWRVVHDPPVRFRRTAGMAALPMPQPGGSITQLRQFVNLSDPHFILYVATIVDALRPGFPHPVLYLAGETGSGKSWLAEIRRKLTDPSTEDSTAGDADLRTLPSTIRDLFVSAYNTYALTFDNVSAFSPAISDTLCQIASGSGFSTRKLFSDVGEVRIGGSRPIVLTGIANAITRPDLADRTVILPLSPIPNKQRRSEKQLRKDFKRQKPLILGALLDAVVCGLKNLPSLDFHGLESQ